MSNRTSRKYRKFNCDKKLKDIVKIGGTGRPLIMCVKNVSLFDTDGTLCDLPPNRLNNRRFGHQVLRWKHLAGKEPPTSVRCDKIKERCKFYRTTMNSHFHFQRSYPFLKEHLNDFLNYQLNEAHFQGTIVKGQKDSELYKATMEKVTADGITNFNPLLLLDCEQPLCTLRPSDPGYITDIRDRIYKVEDQLKRYIQSDEQLQQTPK